MKHIPETSCINDKIRSKQRKTRSFKEIRRTTKWSKTISFTKKILEQVFQNDSKEFFSQLHKTLKVQVKKYTNSVRPQLNQFKIFKNI